MLTKELLMDKISAGWHGKNIGGTLGGPLEGRMELLDVSFYVQKFNGPMPNDDLDLQLVNLHCLEQYGARISTEHIGKEWLSHVFFPYDEYGHALTNMRRGLIPPLAGGYNNLFTDCMGSPIRSEIWAMVAAGNPDLAAYYALQDAGVDHAGGEGVYGEIFFAVMECLAFEHEEKLYLIETALSYIPETCEIAKAVRDTVRLFQEGLSWKEARAYIIEHYATPNFTYAPPNIAFTVIGFLYGKDFADSICIACNCGYDTDCTAATLGALLGIIGGMAVIPQKWVDPIGKDIKVSPAVNGFNAPMNLDELTLRTYNMYCLVMAEWENTPNTNAFSLDYTWECNRWLLPFGSFICPELALTMTFQDNHPAIGSKTKRISLGIENKLNVQYSGSVELEFPYPLTCDKKHDFVLACDEKACFDFDVIREGRENRSNYKANIIIRRNIQGVDWAVHQIPFVLVPMAVWAISGPMGERLAECSGSLIDFTGNNTPTKAGKYTASSILNLPRDTEVEFVLSTTMPVRLLVNGECIIESENSTPFIPAYHRSAAEKRGICFLKAGNHNIMVTVDSRKDNLSETALYFIDTAAKGLLPHVLEYKLYI